MFIGRFFFRGKRKRNDSFLQISRLVQNLSSSDGNVQITINTGPSRVERKYGKVTFAPSASTLRRQHTVLKGLKGMFTKCECDHFACWNDANPDMEFGRVMYNIENHSEVCLFCWVVSHSLFVDSIVPCLRRRSNM